MYVYIHIYIYKYILYHSFTLNTKGNHTIQITLTFCTNPALKFQLMPAFQCPNFLI